LARTSTRTRASGAVVLDLPLLLLGELRRDAGDLPLGLGDRRPLALEARRRFEIKVCCRRSSAAYHCVMAAPVGRHLVLGTRAPRRFAPNLSR